MPDHLQSFQLDFLTPEMFSKIVKRAVSEGTRIRGHHGSYINFHMGDILLVIRTAYDPEKGLDYITGFDSHVKGCCVWDCVICGETKKENQDATEKTLLVEIGNETLPLPLINGDILPAEKPGTKLKAQVAAYPLAISLFAADDKAKTGAVPGGIIANDDATVTLCGEIKGLRRASTVYMGGVMTKFIIALVATDCGEIEVAFPDTFIAEGEEQLLRPGAYLYGQGELAANPAIYELEHGVKEEEA